MGGGVSFERHDALGDDGVACERGGADGARRGGSEESVGTRGAEEMGAASYTASIYDAMVECFIAAVAKHSERDEGNDKKKEGRKEQGFPPFFLVASFCNTLPG